MHTIMYKSLLCEPQLVYSPVYGRLCLKEGAFQIGLMVLLAVVVGYRPWLSP